MVEPRTQAKSPDGVELVAMSTIYTSSRAVRRQMHSRREGALSTSSRRYTNPKPVEERYAAMSRLLQTSREAGGRRDRRVFLWPSRGSFASRRSSVAFRNWD